MRRKVPKKADDLPRPRSKTKALGSLIAAVAASAGVSFAEAPAQAKQAPIQPPGIIELESASKCGQGKLVLRPAPSQTRLAGGGHQSHESHESHSSHSSHYSGGLQ